jgi:hypothetical protein
LCIVFAVVIVVVIVLVLALVFVMRLALASGFFATTYLLCLSRIGVSRRTMGAPRVTLTMTMGNSNGCGGRLGRIPHVPKWVHHSLKHKFSYGRQPLI